jgi:membrane protease YdiL (CAAX protease family)
MSFVTAAIWSVCAVAALDFFLALVMVSAGSAADLDLVSRVLCEAAAFVTTLLFLTVVHERERPLRDVLGLRRPPIVLLLLAALLGVALQGPVNIIASFIYNRYPLPPDEIELLKKLFDVGALHQKIAIVVAAGVLGPAVEEMLFRGGMYGGLLRRHGALRTVLGIALLFALAHREPRNMLPDFLGGIAMGYLRWASGSIWPAVLLHAAFNTTSVVMALVYGPETDVMTRTENLAALAGTVVLLTVFGRLAARSDRCMAARESDNEVKR